MTLSALTMQCPANTDGKWLYRPYVEPVAEGCSWLLPVRLKREELQK